MPEDISRGTSGVLLPPEVSSEVWSGVQEASAVMQLTRETTMPGPGISVPIITGDAEADWVDETDEISVSRPTLDNKTITPYKLGVIVPFSNEFKRDLAGLYPELLRRLPNALAKKFDSTVFGSSAPGSNFDVLGGATAVACAPHASDVKKGTYAGLVEAEATITGNEGEIGGWVLSPQFRSLLRGQVDADGRPLLGNSIIGGAQVTDIFGAPVASSRGVYAAGSPARIGFVGDFADGAVWGAVNDIEITVTDQASITDGVTTLDVGEETVDIPNILNLWQRDMFAVKVVVEVGFRVRNTNRFIKLTNGVRT